MIRLRDVDNVLRGGRVHRLRRTLQHPPGLSTTLQSSTERLAAFAPPLSRAGRWFSASKVELVMFEGRCTGCQGLPTATYRDLLQPTVIYCNLPYRVEA